MERKLDSKMSLDKKIMKTVLPIILFILFIPNFNIFSANYKFEEQEFEELVNPELIEEDIKEFIEEIQEDEKAKNSSIAKTEDSKKNSQSKIEIQIETSDMEEVSAMPPILTEIGGMQVSESDYAQSMIRKYMGIYSSIKGKQTLYHVLDRGEEYRIFIRHKLIEYELPRALEYLPIVESEYRTTATSRSGAKGLWQFMENSIRPFLKKNDWIDERLDPWKSTDAALKKLKDNYNMFGDWAIALAAYNCGAGAMTKITKAHPEMTYWELAEQGYLKKETTHYIPKLLGITELCESPEKYEMELPVIADDSSEIEYDFATTKKPISLTKLSNESKISLKTLKALNPSLIRTVTPPSTGYQIRLPKGTAEQGQIAIDKIQKEMKGNALLYVEHKISSGDTLWGLSRAYNCKIDDICDLNGISKKTILKLGKVLYIPLK